MFDATQSSGTQSGSVHDERIELHSAFPIEEAAAAGVKGVVIFHDDHGFLDGIEGGTAPIEHSPARSKGIADAIQVSVHHLIWNSPCSAVNNQNRIVWQINLKS